MALRQKGTHTAQDLTRLHREIQTAEDSLRSARLTLEMIADLKDPTYEVRYG